MAFILIGSLYRICLPRVSTARLQAASQGGAPVLLRVDFDAGHGIGSTREQVLSQYADIYSFLFWQLGKKG